MREIRLSGSEGGGTGTTRSSLPLSQDDNQLIFSLLLRDRTCGGCGFLSPREKARRIWDAKHMILETDPPFV